jgi:hypothetical protein
MRYASWLACVTLLVGVGCDDNEVKSYSIAKEKLPVAAPPMASGGHSGHTGHGGPQQMFAAIVEQDEQFWFFKVTGDEHFLSHQKDQVVAFLKTLSFKDSDPTWTLPAGWTEQPASGMRFATIIISDASHRSEMSIIPLPKTPILPQVNRWRGQLGLGPLDEAQLEKETLHIDANGLDVSFFSMVGEGSGQMAPAGGGAAAAGGAASDSGALPADHPPVGGAAVPTNAPTTPSAPSAGKPVSYTVPAGWEDLPASGMRVATLKIGDSELTIIPLAAGAGDLVANVNRWRGQVGLTPLDPPEIEAACPEMQIDGGPARYVELMGMSGQSMLGLITIRGSKSWFVKLIAPTDVVVQEKDNFKAFVNSITFN